MISRTVQRSSLTSPVKRLAEKVECEQLFAQRMPKFSADLVALAKERGRLTTAQAEQQTLANRATIKAHLAKLDKIGVPGQTPCRSWHLVCGSRAVKWPSPPARYRPMRSGHRRCGCDVKKKSKK
jgi:hypothetical protein